MNFERDGIEYYGSLVAATERNGYRSKQKKLELDMKNHESSSAKPPIKEAPKLELTVLPPHLRYVLLGNEVTLQVTIAVDLNGQQVEYLVEVLKRFK